VVANNAAVAAPKLSSPVVANNAAVVAKNTAVAALMLSSPVVQA
jgi:hypothetical protein